jgi:hypothetical protein
VRTVRSGVREAPRPARWTQDRGRTRTFRKQERRCRNLSGLWRTVYSGILQRSRRRCPGRKHRRLRRWRRRSRCPGYRRSRCRCVCVFITGGPSTKLCGYWCRAPQINVPPTRFDKRRSIDTFSTLKKNLKNNLNLFSSSNHEQTYEPRVVISTALLITSLP